MTIFRRIQYSYLETTLVGLGEDVSEREESVVTKDDDELEDKMTLNTGSFFDVVLVNAADLSDVNDVK